MKYRLKDDIDLAYNPNQRRGPDGRWVDDVLATAKANIDGGYISADMDYLAEKAAPKTIDRAKIRAAYDAAEAKVSATGPDIKTTLAKRGARVPSYADVESVYDWKNRDALGSDGGATAKTSIRQQGIAQILAKSWYESMPDSAPTDEKAAAGMWEQYQNPNLYGTINSILRTKKSEAGDPDYSTVKRIVDEMFRDSGETTTKDMEVVRALRSGTPSASIATRDHATDWSKKFKVGDVFEDDGIVSTTAHNRFAQGWLSLGPSGEALNEQKPNDVVMTIKIPKGSRIVGGDPQFIETMLPPGSRFKIVSVKHGVTAKKAANPVGSYLDPSVPPFKYTEVIAELVS
jgi:hypothetical protein